MMNLLLSDCFIESVHIKKGNYENLKNAQTQKTLKNAKKNLKNAQTQKTLKNAKKNMKNT